MISLQEGEARAGQRHAPCRVDGQVPQRKTCSAPHSTEGERPSRGWLSAEHRLNAGAGWHKAAGLATAPQGCAESSSPGQSPVAGVTTREAQGIGLHRENGSTCLKSTRLTVQPQWRALKAVAMPLTWEVFHSLNLREGVSPT